MSVTAQTVDAFGQDLFNDDSNDVRIITDRTSPDRPKSGKCGFNSDYRVYSENGATEAVMTKGIASVTDFRGSCTPGGYINASIATDIVNSIFLEFPNYKNETFAKATKQTIVGDFTLKFRSCIVGEKFDFLLQNRRVLCVKIHIHFLKTMTI